jgi:AraC-like DNA-binding protein
MRAAITFMHDNPGHRWTLQELAERVGMSRSIFALRFKETVGETPMEYLTRWRMLLAGDRLMTPGNSVSDIALTLGYESESAFGKAFKRVMGCSPRQYGYRSRPPSPSPAVTQASYDDRMELATGV